MCPPQCLIATAFQGPLSGGRKRRNPQLWVGGGVVISDGFQGSWVPSLRVPTTNGSVGTGPMWLLAVVTPEDQLLAAALALPATVTQIFASTSCDAGGGVAIPPPPPV